MAPFQQQLEGLPYDPLKNKGGNTSRTPTLLI
jgi:hypothetical protein